MRALLFLFAVATIVCADVDDDDGFVFEETSIVLVCDNVYRANVKNPSDKFPYCDQLRVETGLSVCLMFDKPICQFPDDYGVFNEIRLEAPTGLYRHPKERLLCRFDPPITKPVDVGRVLTNGLEWGDKSNPFNLDAVRFVTFEGGDPDAWVKICGSDVVGRARDGMILGPEVLGPVSLCVLGPNMSSTKFAVLNYPNIVPSLEEWGGIARYVKINTSTEDSVTLQLLAAHVDAPVWKMVRTAPGTLYIVSFGFAISGASNSATLSVNDGVIWGYGDYDDRAIAYFVASDAVSLFVFRFTTNESEMVDIAIDHFGLKAVPDPIDGL